jgi:mono/diheme cytochrome c family protein
MLPTDEDLYRTVTFGIPTTTMPPFADVLTERERRDVVAYIKGFSKNFENMSPAEPITIREEPEATAQSIAEGKSVYMINACWTCHGAAGKGTGEAASALKDVWGQEIRPVDFTLGKYKGGSDNRSIFRTINTGLTGTPMPSFAESYLYGSDSVNLPATLSKAYADTEIAQLRAYLDSQPTQEEISNMSDSAKESLTDRRAWALVHYLNSLSREPGLWHRLFVEDTEVTSDR